MTRARVTVSPAVFVWQSVQSDGSLSTRTFEETLHGIVPVQAVILLHTAIRRLKVSVTTLEGREHGKHRLTFQTF